MNQEYTLYAYSEKMKLKNVYISFPGKHNNAYLNDKGLWYHPCLHDVKMPVNSFPHSNLVHTIVNTN